MAKTIIDELVTLLTVKTDSKSKTAFANFQRSLLKIKKSAVIVGAAMAAAATGFGVLTTKVDQSIDAQAKFAKSIGVSFSHLQELQFAGKKVGASTEDINSSLETLTKTMSSPIPGEYNKTLLLLGINVRNAKNQLKPATEVLLELSNKFKGLSKIQQIQVGEKLGINAGTIRLLQQGSKAIADAMKEAKGLGGVLPDASGRRAAKFENSFLRLKTTLSGLARIIVVNLTPAIVSAIDKMEAFILSNRKLISTNLKAVVIGAAQGFMLFIKVLSSVVSIVDKLITGFSAATTSIKGTKSAAIVTFVALSALVVALLPEVTLLRLAFVGVAVALLAIQKGLEKVKKLTTKLDAGADAAIQKGIEKVKKLSRKGAAGAETALKKIIFSGFLQKEEKTPTKLTAKNSIPLLQKQVLRNTSFPFLGGAASNTTTQNATTNQANKSVQHVTINVNGAKSPRAVAEEVTRQMGLESSVQIASPGFNRPAVA